MSMKNFQNDVRCIMMPIGAFTCLYKIGWGSLISFGPYVGVLMLEYTSPVRGVSGGCLVPEHVLSSQGFVTVVSLLVKKKY